MADLNCGIYSITSPSGKSYIGSSKDIQDRWRRHSGDLKKGSHHSRALQSAWIKYNGSLVFKKLLVCAPEDLLFYEQLLLDSFKPEYNMSPTAGRPLGIKRSEETKTKISKSLEGNKRAAANLGKIRTQEFKDRVGDFFKGKHLSAEHKRKLSISRKDIIFTEEHKSNIGKAHIGLVLSDTHKKNISNALKGRVFSEEHKQNLSKARKNINV